MGQLMPIQLKRYAPNGVLPRHDHDHATLCVVVAGSYQDSIRNRAATHGPGALLFCPPHEPHSQIIGGVGATKLILSPSPAQLASLADAVSLDQAPWISSREIARLGNRMVAELAVDDGFSAVALEGLCCEVLARFGRAARRPADPPARQIKAACDHMADHLGEPLSVRDIATAVSCNPVRLSRAFRRTFGITMGQHQRRLRTARAAELLASTAMPIAEIAQICGFCDQPHLTRAFRAELGCTPAAFRRRA